MGTFLRWKIGSLSLAYIVLVIDQFCVAVQLSGVNNGWNPDNGVSEIADQRSGYVDISTGAHVFFWLFESRLTPAKDPLVLWLTGGPGCSSELAIFYEQGPFRFRDGESEVVINKFAWNAVANMVFIDQPRGTGFSYVDATSTEPLDIDEETISDDLYEFLQGFLIQFPEYVGRDVFLTGESYAGHYIPVLAKRILTGNSNNDGVQIDLKGIAIGNGWVNGYYQFPAMLEYAKQHSLVVNDPDIIAGLQQIVDLCQKQMQQDRRPSQSTFEQCAALERYLIDNPIVHTRDFNYYDIRKDCGPFPECYDFQQVELLMRDENTLDRLGVKSDNQWDDCSSSVFQNLIPDQQLECDKFIPGILSAGVQVLIYNGVEDFICNHIGTEAWVGAMKWSGDKNLSNQKWREWEMNGVAAGAYKKEGGLLLATVYDAGHMVPMDQPERSLELFTKFINGEPLQDMPILIIE